MNDSSSVSSDKSSLISPSSKLDSASSPCPAPSVALFCPAWLPQTSFEELNGSANKSWRAQEDAGGGLEGAGLVSRSDPRERSERGSERGSLVGEREFSASALES